MTERLLGDGKTVVHDEAYIALRRSTGKGGRLVFIESNEMGERETPLARVYDYERFLEAWKQQGKPPMLSIFKE